MPDSLGQRGKFGVLAPSTNTSVQPEFDAMRPWGITHHHSRLVIPDSKVTDDESFMAMMDNIRGALFPALESVLTCDPDYVILSAPKRHESKHAHPHPRAVDFYEEQVGKENVLHTGANRYSFICDRIHTVGKRLHFFRRNQRILQSLLELRVPDIRKRLIVVCET